MTLPVPPDAARAMSEALQPNIPEPTSPESVGKFEALMQQPLVAPGGDSSAQGSHIVDAIVREDGQMQAALEQVANLSAQSGTLSAGQQIAASAQVALNLSLAQFDFQSKMAVVTASKSSAETLMKNQ
jgi:type III secretion inner rod protein HrpB2